MNKLVTSIFLRTESKLFFKITTNFHKILDNRMLDTCPL